MRYFFLGYNVDASLLWSRHHTSVFAKKLKGRAHQSLPPSEPELSRSCQKVGTCLLAATPSSNLRGRRCE